MLIETPKNSIDKTVKEIYLTRDIHNKNKTFQGSLNISAHYVSKIMDVFTEITCRLFIV